MLRLLNERPARLLLPLFIFALIVIHWAKPAHACGDQTDCLVESGAYRILLPQTIKADEKVPAIVYIHGLGGSAEETLGNEGFRTIAKQLGVALVAVSGLDNSWTFRNGVVRGEVRDEFAYFREVVEDIKTRFPIDSQKIVAAGFSIGASMTWYLACLEPDNFAGFIPIAGTMWRPQPEKCARPIGEIYHFHGFSDRTFPLDGRPVHGKHQGAISDTFEIMFNQDECTRKIIKRTTDNGLVCKHHKNCGGETLRFCLHSGAHDVEGAHLVEGFREIAKARGF